MQHALGHSSLRSTERYLAWSQSVTKLRKAMGGRRYGEGPARLIPWAAGAIAGAHLVLHAFGYHIAPVLS